VQIKLHFIKTTFQLNQTHFYTSSAKVAAKQELQLETTRGQQYISQTKKIIKTKHYTPTTAAKDNNSSTTSPPRQQKASNNRTKTEQTRKQQIIYIKS
jgi:hypothetical protein